MTSHRDWEWSKIVPGNSLYPNGFHLKYGDYRFILQEDGNLVFYHGNQALWASGTNGQSVKECKFQYDGNLVIYSPEDKAVWASNSTGFEPLYLGIKIDNHAYNVVILDRQSNVKWSTGL